MKVGNVVRVHKGVFTLMNGVGRNRFEEECFGLVLEAGKTLLELHTPFGRVAIQHADVTLVCE